MTPVKNIIFDLGGVFMNLDFSLTTAAFRNLGVNNFEEMFTQHHSNDLFEQLETGVITPAVFYDAFRQVAKTSSTNEAIKTAWNALLLDFPMERLDWLEEINKRYRVFLFSNTNLIHYEAFTEIFTRTTGRHLNSYFIKACYSHEIGARKPYVASFRKLLDDLDISAAETLFIDDTFPNAEGAREAGMQAIHLVAPRTVLDLDL